MCETYLTPDGKHKELFDQSTELELAAYYGDLAKLRYLVEEAPNPVDITAYDNECICTAAAMGRLNIVRYLIEEAPKFGQQPVDITVGDNFCIRFAYDGNHFDVVRYLFKEAPFITGHIPKLGRYEDMEMKFKLTDCFILREKLMKLEENGTPHTMWREALEVLESHTTPVSPPKV